MSYLNIHHGMGLIDAVRDWKRLGGLVVKKGSSAKRVGKKPYVMALKPFPFKEVFASPRREESGMMTRCENDVG